jgi:choline dehydrogenase-like flavoprotein
VVNGAMAFRAPEAVLDRWAAATGLPDLAMTGLDPAYRRVERLLSVATQDPGSAGRDQELLRSGADRLGWEVIDNTRAQVHCAGCNVCTWGCPTGAKQSMLVSYIERAVHFGATVVSECRVDRVELRGKRAVGVTATTAPAGVLPVGAHEGGPAPGGTLRVHARRVIVAGGAVQTPALLLRSGVRVPSGRLGSGLALHPGAQVAARFDELVEGWKGAHQTHQIREFIGEGLLLAAVNLPPSLVARSLLLDGPPLHEAMLDYDRMVTAGILVEDTGRGRVRASGRSGRPLATYRLHERDAAAVMRGLSLLSRALFAAGAAEVRTGLRSRPLLRSMGEAEALEHLAVRPGELSLSTVHLMGTAGIGADPLRSVCALTGAVHETADLYVADAGLFPGPVGVNPMLTISALATGVARAIIEEWP